jgi:hypothetical protein
MRLLIVALVTFTAVAQTPAIDWSNGVAYAYDGSGNIKTIGANTFIYDGAGRLIQATTNGVTRTYTYGICLPLEVMNDRRAIAKHLLEGIEC